MSFVGAGQLLARRLGLEIRRFRPAAPRRAKLLRELEIDVVLDAGANVGQYARELRAAGYRGRIISFEPVREAYAELERRAQRDPSWETHRLALGERDGTRTIGVASNLASSSLLTINQTHRELFPYVSIVGSEPVRVAALDSLDLDLGRAPLLKLDVQGYEEQVLRGAEATLQRIRLIECEMCVVPHYEGQPALPELLQLLRDRGFRLQALEPAGRDVHGGTPFYNAILGRVR